MFKKLSGYLFSKLGLDLLQNWWAKLQDRKRTLCFYFFLRNTICPFLQLMSQEAESFSLVMNVRCLSGPFEY